MHPADELRVLSIGNVYPPHILGGYELVWRGVNRLLRDEGSHVRVLTTRYRRSEVPAGAAEDSDVYRELDWYWHDHAWPLMGFRRRLELERHNAGVFDRHVEEFRPDVVAWWPLGGMSLGLVERARRHGLPAVFFVHDYWPRYGRERDLWTHMWSGLPGLRALVARLTGLPTHPRLTEAGRWLFNSEAVRRDTERSGLRVRDGAILSPGVERIFLEAPRDPVPSGWGWRLLYVGRVVPQKGVLTAVQALAELPVEATLRVVGEGDPDYAGELRRAADQLGVAHRVRFDPPQRHDQVIEVYRGSDVVVFPVLWDEPWGLVPLEAMALGRPVVGTGRGGSGEFMRDGDNALLFAPDDPADLATCVRALADDPELLERLRIAGYRTAVEHSEDEFNRRAVEEIRACVNR